MTRPALLAALAAAPLAIVASQPAAAQEDVPDTYNTVIIYGDDECPQTSDVITVCARMDESERYRIPSALRQSDSPANESWPSKVRSYETVGDFGPLSCTAIGAGGELGCTAKFIEAAYAERAQGENVRFGQLIAEARAERLSTIDAEAADTQARVEELERAYMERLRREQEGEVATAVDPSPPPAEIADPDRLPPADLGPPQFEDDEDMGPQPLEAGAPTSIP